MMNDGREVILAFPGPGELLGERLRRRRRAALGHRARGRRRRGARHPRQRVPGVPRAPSARRARAPALGRRAPARRPTASASTTRSTTSSCASPSRLVDLCDRYGAEDEAGIDIGLAITAGRAGRVGGRVPRGRRQGDGAAAHARAGSRPSGGGSSCSTSPRCAATRADTASARACRSTRSGARGAMRVVTPLGPPIASARSQLLPTDRERQVTRRPPMFDRLSSRPASSPSRSRPAP